ncbi:hypothetical protein BT96DRAFT_948935 [Gymnopus androsaceus JB14]|uniref:Uncharacterized protein n=1 Tax=Gymnopus androsaceus JB14 TaxID=1447944 RepID=A0A6A4GMY2_9AGAR|nr:hypothetical protein BT96DRAFT_948935 [Gymnopus androsaceus JB14]
MATPVTTLGTRMLGTMVPVTTNEMGTVTTGDVMFMTPSTVALFKVGRATWNVPGLAATVQIPGVSTKQGQYRVQKKRICNVQPRERGKKQVESGYKRIIGVPTDQHLISVARSTYGITGRENAKGQCRLSVSKECCLHSTKKFAKETGKMTIDGRGEKMNSVVGEGVEVIELLLDNEAQHCIVY